MDSYFVLPLKKTEPLCGCLVRRPCAGLVRGAVRRACAGLVRGLVRVDKNLRKPNICKDFASEVSKIRRVLPCAASRAPMSTWRLERKRATRTVFYVFFLARGLSLGAGSAKVKKTIVCSMLSC